MRCEGASDVEGDGGIVVVGGSTAIPVVVSSAASVGIVVSAGGDGAGCVVA